MALPASSPRSVLVIGCGALARELLTVVSRNHLEGIRVECLPAILHNRPEKIPGAVRARLEAAEGYDEIFVAYGDCGTGGMLDKVLEEFGVERLSGPHCYQFFAGIDRFDTMHDEDPGTLYLTDYLTRHFERLIWQGLALDRHPELLEDYFGHYNRVVYLAQTDDPSLTEEAQAAADRLGLAFERHLVGYGLMEPALVRLTITSEGGRPPSNPPTAQEPAATAGNAQPASTHPNTPPNPTTAGNAQPASTHPNTPPNPTTAGNAQPASTHPNTPPNPATAGNAQPASTHPNTPPNPATAGIGGRR